MYQNLYFERQRNLMHIWDDHRGYTCFPFQKYAYKKDPHGDYESIFGDRLKKVYNNKKGQPGLFESDVSETTRVLVDMYESSDDPSEGHIVMPFDIEVEMETGLPDTQEAENEITAIGFYDSETKEYFVYILDKDDKLQDKKYGNAHVKRFDNERNLLASFLNKYEEISPTILTGWNIDYFDIPYLFNRLKNVLGYEEACRLSKIGLVHYNSFRDRYFIAGTACMDYMMLYKLFTYNELDNYRLDTIGRTEVDMGKIEYNGSLDDLFNNDIEAFIKYNLVDVEIIVRLDEKLQYIDLARGIAHVGHVPYEDIVFSSKYLEGAILTYLRRNGLVAPNKPRNTTKGVSDEEEEGSGFAGAYVKDPIVGLYRWIYDLDLTSLYPSIIMSLNISPETKVGLIDNWDPEKYVRGEDNNYKINDTVVTCDRLKEFLTDMNYSVSPNGVMYRMDKVGCIPQILDTWFNKRAEYRKLEKKFGLEGDEEQHKFYAKRQLVQKILLNSLYGVLGLVSFRFYDLDNALAVTSAGQAVIKKSADMGNIKYNKELGTKGKDYNIYIDTDSVFFSAEPLLDNRHDNWEDWEDGKIAEHVMDIADEMQVYLNDFYDILAKRYFNIDNHRFEIKKEFTAKSGIWIRKKRYAQHIILANGVPVDRLDVKGLDVVRSSFPKAFREFMSETLMDILHHKKKEEINEKILTFKENLSKLDIREIAKSSSVKNMSKYSVDNPNRLFEFQKSTPAHVKSAIAFNQLLSHYKCPFRYQPFTDGDKIKWVYLKNNPLGLESVGFRGYEDPDEITDLINMYIDYDKIFERELESKLNDFYTALGWGVVSNKAPSSDKFFEF